MVGAAADAQSIAPSAGSRLRAGPAAAVETASRDTEGRLVIRAQPLPERLLIDGRLDESFYTDYGPAGGFVQAEPRYSEPATEQTQVWVFFDDRAVYSGIRCFDTQPEQ